MNPSASDTDPSAVSFEVNGELVEIGSGSVHLRGTLLDVLREQLHLASVKDGCSPQGQCGCCTVLVDGAPRVACVTPVRRMKGRSVTTLEGLSSERRDAWAEALCATGGSQCGFCTPGIVLRLEGDRRGAGEPGRVRQALSAHLCRCTGWQTIVEAAALVGDASGPAGRDLEAASRRATIEGRSPQVVGPHVALGEAGFAADTAPTGALRAVRSGDGSWVVGSTLAEARASAGKTQGRRTTAPPVWPVEPPPGEWAQRLRTTWVEPAYLETDSAWCEPGDEPVSALANGGAFGAKSGDLEVAAAARALADRHRQPVLALASREDTVRLGPKRPPVAGAVRSDGTGVLRVAIDEGSLEVLATKVAIVAPGLVVEAAPVAGPPTSSALRAAAWAEAALLALSVTDGPAEVRSPDGSVAVATVDESGIHVEVRCGRVLDEVVLRSYCIGAAHMAWSWVVGESLSVSDNGEPLDLTVRSFGIARAVDTPAVRVTILDDVGEPVNGSDAVFAAVAAATWRSQGCPECLPTGRMQP